jgi:uncharacterized glyoxalase superfamily protein PhnB
MVSFACAPTPTDRPFQERTVGVKDAFGNVWYLATYTGGVST